MVVSREQVVSGLESENMIVLILQLPLRASLPLSMFPLFTEIINSKTVHVHQTELLLELYFMPFAKTEGHVLTQSPQRGLT